MNQETNNLKSGRLKKLCIALIILLTLIMVFDIGNFFLTPAQSQFTPGGNRHNFDSSFSPSDRKDVPDRDFQMDENGHPENFSPEDMPQRGDAPSQNSSFLQTLRKYWLPVLLICAAGDAACILIFLHLRKQTEKASETDDTTMPELIVDDEDDTPKRKKGPWASILCVVVAAALILAMLPTEKEAASSTTVTKKVVSGTAESANISTILSGAGTLEADSLTAVTIPQKVTVLKYHVRNGETVSAGDPLVSVDKTSAAAALKNLSSVLKVLDADLESARQQSNTSTLTATASGRVKKIYVSSGDSVTDVMVQHGALMLLSLDGLMQVSFPSDKDLTVGETVTISYEGKTEEGKIASVRQGIVTVTLSDATAPYGMDATILNSNGSTIGNGTLEIHSEMKVVSYYGTVKSLMVSENSQVWSGGTLLTVAETGSTTDYQILLARRNELDAQMQQLSALSQSGMVYAQNDGVVSGIPSDAEIELLTARDEAPVLNLLSGTESGFRLMLLSDFVPNEEVTPVEEQPTPEPENPDGQEQPGEQKPEHSEETTLNGTYCANLLKPVSGNTIHLDISSTPLSYTGGDSVSLRENGETRTVSLSELQAGDLLVVTISNNTVTGISYAVRTGSQGGPGEGEQGGGAQGGGPQGGAPSGGNAGSSMPVVKSYESYDASENELLYISDQQEVSLTISVDELDILTLQKGLSAQITLDAMKGQSFEGIITRINHTGSNEGGNTKFSVTVQFQREANMLDGMNASVKITTASQETKVSIPAAALQEDDGKTYVYTAYDAKSDTLSGLTEVETGVSDGKQVEILSGLELGQPYYYRYADSVTYNFLTI